MLCFECVEHLGSEHGTCPRSSRRVRDWIIRVSIAAKNNTVCTHVAFEYIVYLL